MAFSKLKSKRDGASSTGRPGGEGGGGRKKARPKQSLLVSIAGRDDLVKPARRAALLIKEAKSGAQRQLPSAKSLGLQLKEVLARQWRPGRAVQFFAIVGKKGHVTLRPAGVRTWPREKETGLNEALDRARERGRVLAAEILNQHDMLSAEQFGRLTGTSRETINTWRHKHLVLGLAGAKRGYRFPAWQLNQDGKPFDVLPVLFDRLGGGPWSVYRFLVQPHPELGGLTGQEALREGKTEEVLDAADSITRGAFS